ncbi:hypothetical protein MTP99_006747 [Tenebrio molitor]|jgi:hypothetical protein|nr:hypothetical protein MTP99_006747 [Tenebrio molitor]
MTANSQGRRTRGKDGRNSELGKQPQNGGCHPMSGRQRQGKHQGSSETMPEQLESLIRRLAPKENPKHFTHCTARFSGTRQHEAVEEFIASVDFFKSSKGISDASALLGLQLLVEGQAHTWWVGIKTLATA